MVAPPIHQRFDPQEVFEVIEGVGSRAQVLRAGLLVIVPIVRQDGRHSAKALTDGRAILVDCALSTGFD